MKAKTIKNLLLGTVLIALLAFFVVHFKVVSKDTFYTKNNELKQVGVVEFGIYTNSIKDKSENNMYKSGVLYEERKMPIYENESCYDMLVRLTKEKKIMLDAGYSEIYDSAYVKGINDLYEFDYGDLSGWIYSINKEQASIGCAQVYPKDGDIIRWHYSVSMGSDIVEW